MVVMGKRVFPVGLITSHINPEQAREIAQAGFDFVLTDSLSERYPIDGALKLLDACLEAELMVVMQFMDIGDPMEMRARALTYRDHPAVIGWHLFEEPVYAQFTLAEIDTTWRELRRLDPYHFFEVIDWSYSSMRRYAPWAGIVIPDRYPIGHTPKPPFVEAIREQIEIAHAASNRSGPVCRLRTSCPTSSGPRPRRRNGPKLTSQSWLESAG